MKIAVISDSSCGSEIFKKYKNLKLVPLMINKENGDSFPDDYNTSKEEFYSLLEKELLKTSMSLPVVTLSKGLSGQYQTTQMMSQEEEYKGKVFVVDTNGVSIVQYRFIEMIYKLIEEGKNAQEIQVEINSLNETFVGYIIPKNLERLVKGGRISKAAAAMAKILKIVPILKYNGEIDKETKTRTFKKAIEEALALIKSKTSHNIIDIAFSKADTEVIDLVTNLVKENGFELGLFEELPNVITCHTGFETFALLS
ncbi:hypothetical protein FQR65_LT17090 [Abscondita terminalis]|nr:hypothetical protein FQR65_LT17090 [Abscondita terminalis]